MGCCFYLLCIASQGGPTDGGHNNDIDMVHASEAPSLPTGHSGGGDAGAANGVRELPRQQVGGDVRELGRQQQQQQGVKRERSEDADARPQQQQQQVSQPPATAAAAPAGVDDGGDPLALLDPVLLEEETAQVLDQAKAGNGMVRINNATWWTTDAEIQAMASEFGQVVRLRMYIVLGAGISWICNLCVHKRGKIDVQGMHPNVSVA